jgi:hypothetical protein
MVLKKQQKKAQQDQLEEEACTAAVRLRGDGPERVRGSVSLRHAGLLLSLSGASDDGEEGKWGAEGAQLEQRATAARVQASHTDHLCAWSPPHSAARLACFGAAAICGCFAGRAPLTFGRTVVRRTLVPFRGLLPLGHAAIF